MPTLALVLPWGHQNYKMAQLTAIGPQVDGQPRAQKLTPGKPPPTNTYPPGSGRRVLRVGFLSHEDSVLCRAALTLLNEAL